MTESSAAVTEQETPNPETPTDEKLYDKTEEPSKEDSKDPVKEDSSEEKQPEKTEDEKPAEKKDDSQTEPVPLKAPEGSSLQAADIEKIAAFAKEQGFSNEQAQALVNRESETLSGYVKQQQTTLNTTAENWEKTIKQDKELGGEHFEGNLKTAQQALKRFGSEDLVKGLNETRLGNHPELFRFCLKVGKAMADDQAVKSDGAPSKKQLTAAEVLYKSSEDASTKE